MAKLSAWLPRIPALARKEKASLGQIREASILSNLGHGPEWANESYADYYFTSVPAYRAVQVRADAIGSARLIVGEETTNEGGRTEFIPADKEHEAQSVLDSINPWFARADYGLMLKPISCYLAAPSPSSSGRRGQLSPPYGPCTPPRCPSYRAEAQTRLRGTSRAFSTTWTGRAYRCLRKRSGGSGAPTPEMNSPACRPSRLCVSHW